MALEIRKKSDLVWQFIDTLSLKEFIPSKFSINTLENSIVVVFKEGANSAVYNLSDVLLYDLGAVSPFPTFLTITSFMLKLEELRCPCFGNSSGPISATDYEKILFQKANGIFGTHTGNTTETTILVLDMDGGQFIPSDMMEFLFDFTKVGVLGSVDFKIRAGVTGTTTDELIALMSGFGRLDLCIERKRIQFLSGNIIQSSGANNPTDASYFFDPKFLKPLTYSANWKLSVTAQLENPADTINLVGYKVKQSKSTA